MKRRDHFHAIDRKQYDARRFKNPYFQRVATRPWKPIVAVVVFFGLVAAGGAYLLMADRFDYTEVAVEGVETFPSSDVVTAANDYLDRTAMLFSSRRNQFLFRSKDLETRLRSSFAFDQLTIQTHDQTIRISVKEKTSQLLWESDTELYLVALDGIVTRSLTTEERAVLDAPPAPPAPTEPPVIVTELADAVDVGVPAAPIAPPEPVLINPLLRMPVMRDVNDAAVTIGKPVMTDVEITNLFAFHDKLRQQKISFSETQIDRTAGKWVAVKTEIGYAILFDLTGDLDRQALNLQTILAESVPDQSKLEYVDLRFDDHVYYKLE